MGKMVLLGELVQGFKRRSFGVLGKMKVSDRMRGSWSSFRSGQSAHKAGIARIDNPYSLAVGMTGLTEHDRQVYEKSWFQGWDKPNK